jgi:hypothetical protein
MFEQFYALSIRHDRELGVSWSISPHAENEFMFHSFYRRGSRKGNGAAALNEVCNLADRNNVTLRLWTIYPQLHSYYERFGFIRAAENPTSSVDFVRQPQLMQAQAA